MKGKDNNKIQKRKNTKTSISKKSGGAYLSDLMAETAINNFSEIVTSVNNFSAGLSVAIPNSVFLSDYNKALTAQRETVALIDNMTSSFVKNNSSILDSAASMSSTIANIGIATVSANKFFASDLIDKNQLNRVSYISDQLLDVIQSQQSVFASTISEVNNPAAYVGKILSTSPLQLISSGVETMARAISNNQADINFPNLLVVEEVNRDYEKDLPEYQKTIDSMLIKIDPKFVEYRKATWDTFNKKGRDYIGQSSSSMRRLVDGLLHTLAPDGEVEKTEFFKSDKGSANGRPTRGARLRYIVKLEEKRGEHYERLINGIESLLKVYENLPTWDHAPIKEDKFVWGALIAIEGHLLSLLSSRG